LFLEPAGGASGFSGEAFAVRFGPFPSFGFFSAGTGLACGADFDLDKSIDYYMV